MLVGFFRPAGSGLGPVIPGLRPCRIAAQSLVPVLPPRSGTHRPYAPLKEVADANPSVHSKLCSGYQVECRGAFKKDRYPCRADDILKAHRYADSDYCVLCEDGSSPDSVVERKEFILHFKRTVFQVAAMDMK